MKYKYINKKIKKSGSQEITLSKMATNVHDMLK